MAPLNNIRHERFVREYIKHDGHCSYAYKLVYPGVARSTAWVNGCKLAKRPDIAARITEVRARMIKRSDITEEKILTQYQEAYDLAKQQGKTGDMVSASTAQAKLTGLLRDRIEAGGPGDFDSLQNVSDVLKAVEKEAGPEAALMLAKAMGLDKEPNTSDEPTEVDQPEEIDLAELPAVTDARN